MRRIGLGPGVAGKRIVVQGFGKVGYWAARSCHEAGAVIVGIAEHDGAIETATGDRFTPDQRAAVIRGPDELTVVNSGLEEIMSVAYREIRETLARRPEMGSLRIAAMANAIEKVARSYLSLGVFP